MEEEEPTSRRGSHPRWKDVGLRRVGVERGDQARAIIIEETDHRGAAAAMVVRRQGVGARSPSRKGRWGLSS